jgi:hypothetical protein
MPRCRDERQPTILRQQSRHASPEQAFFQSFALGLGRWLRRGDLVQILADWSEELCPPYAYHPSRHLWEAHTRTESETRDVSGTMATMVAQPYVNHITFPR